MREFEVWCVPEQRHIQQRILRTRTRYAIKLWSWDQHSWVTNTLLRHLSLEFYLNVEWRYMSLITGIINVIYQAIAPWTKNTGCIVTYSRYYPLTTATSHYASGIQSGVTTPVGSFAFFLGDARASNKNIHKFFYIPYVVYGTRGTRRGGWGG